MNKTTYQTLATNVESQKSILYILLLVSLIFVNNVRADAWLENNANAIWERSPGVYKENSNWYIIFHAAANDTNVQLYGDFTNGETNPISLTRTPDGKFWWFKGTDSSFSRAPVHGDEYRFKLTRNGVSETFQDPAARWVTHSGLDTGMSKINLTDDYQWQSNSWTRPSQEELNIYQVHPLRFTGRNNTTPFEEVIEEIDADGNNDYIINLGVTALELLPVNEFAGALSWGYNPSFFYAVESSYGGPDQLKKLVDTAHKNGIAVILDLEFNHVATGDNILWTIDDGTYMDGDTVWGALYNFNNDVAKHFLIQNVIYLANEYRIDGFRFDHTNTIHNPNSGFVTVPGDGGGWDFLREMYGKTKAVDPNIWFTAEELPDWYGLTADNAGTVVEGSIHAPMDSQWTDTFHDNFKAVLTGGHLDDLWPVFGHFGDGWQDATVYTESHDEVGNTDDRIAKRGRDGKGWEMSQVSLAGTILARGTPMVFMGQEGGETQQFHIDWWDDRLPLDDYEADASRQKILKWYQKLNEIRATDLTNFATGNSLVTHIHNNNGIAAFTRFDAKYVVVMNFGGSTYFNYDIGVSGFYREIANTSWAEYNLGGVTEASRGNASAFEIANVHIPAYGVVVLEKETPVQGQTISITFSCNNGSTQWGQNIYVVGDTVELGNWDPANAIKLEPTNYPTWTGTFDGFTASSDIEWKCIKRDVGNVIWQNGSNNSVTTPSFGSTSSSGSF
jgi:1,4-alpha-glucan branching enzyme